jgi:hypothetical protein
MQVNENTLKDEIGQLSKRVTELSDNLCKVSYWILGIFALFIPQIIFLFQKCNANRKLQKLNEKVKGVSENVTRLKNELKAAQENVNNSGCQITKSQKLQLQTKPAQPSLGEQNKAPLSSAQKTKSEAAAQAETVRIEAAAEEAAQAKAKEACIVIQKSVRGMNGRKEAQAQAEAAQAKAKEACIVIQKSVRGMNGRKEAQAKAAQAKAKEACIVIQKSVRGMNGRKEAQAKAAQAEAAAQAERVEVEDPPAVMTVGERVRRVVTSVGNGLSEAINFLEEYPEVVGAAAGLVLTVYGERQRAAEARRQEEEEGRR